MYTSKLWQLKDPIDHFFFDCDGTLSLIEGIDILAAMNHVAEEVVAITRRCMSLTGMSPTDYQRRLEYIRPTIDQITLLTNLYIEHCTPGAREVVQILHQLNKKVYVISAGIKTAIQPFAEYLGIQQDRVRAVNLFFDDKGMYEGYDETSNMIYSNGKTLEIMSLLSPGERSLLVGDGVTDLEACDAVTRFIGFAGKSPIERVRQEAKFYINTDNLFAVLPLGLTKDEVHCLSLEHKMYFEKGLKNITESFVLL